MSTFRTGDLVRRISGEHGTSKIGQVREVAEVVSAGAIKLMPLAGVRETETLTGNPFTYDADRFELHTRREDRVVTKPAGRKDDSGKLDMTLLDDMPRALKAVVQVMQWAVTEKKPTPYERGSWLGVHADRYRAAIMRHMRDAAEQASQEHDTHARFQCDKETNLLHLAHVATSALMALENAIREQEKINAVS